MAALARFGVAELFTLSGGHIFPLLDAAHHGGVRLYDVRHEQTAAFAAEGIARLTRRPGVAALTAGPGVTNGVSAITSARFNGSPVVVLGGRAPQARWGAGSLQEIDHVPIVAPVTKLASTVFDVADVVDHTYAAVESALTPHRGPVFVDFPLDVLFSDGEGVVPDRDLPRGADPDPDALVRVADALARSRRPAVIAGSDVWLDGAHEALVALVEHHRLPTFTNGLGRGCVPAGHELSFSRVRSLLRTEADLVIVIGTPLDFRLGFGNFGDAAVVHIVDAPVERTGSADPVLTAAGDLTSTLSALAAAPAGPVVGERLAWVRRLRDAEDAERVADAVALASEAVPIVPPRIYGELARVLDSDAVVVGDGGDFVSYAGKYVDVHRPGRWLDPGPYGCLGTGLGYAMAARIAHPDSQVVLLLGDGAAGFSLMDVDTLVRHRLPVVMVVGNNAGWGLEKHPMRQLYGYDVAAELAPSARYDQVVSALGGAGETVERPDELAPALRRAFASEVPYLVNVLTDPEDAYPRRSNLG